MTREEAIKELKIELSMWESDCKSYHKTKEALNMAIKALQAEPCEDAISREDVIKAIDRHTFNTDDGLCLDEDISIILEEVAPVTHVQNWIPTRERLPENKTYVLTTIKVPNRIAHARSGWYEGGFFHNDNGDVWRSTDMEVLAWMPLPKPYKTEMEGEE